MLKFRFEFLEQLNIVFYAFDHDIIEIFFLFFSSSINDRKFHIT